MASETPYEMLLRCNEVLQQQIITLAQEKHSAQQEILRFAKIMERAESAIKQMSSELYESANERAEMKSVIEGLVQRITDLARSLES